MGRKRKNTFSKALGHLKSTKITEAAPVNSTTGVYSITPGTLTRVEPGPDVPDYSTIDLIGLASVNIIIRNMMK